MKKKRPPRWARLSDSELLQLRFRDLRLTLKGTVLERALNRLYRELTARGIAFRPHVWLAEEWFSPDGVPGFAVPFYLVHRRLAQLERRMGGQAEGSNLNWLMRILRHETGHAIDNAYRLRRKRAWRETFGPASLPYPERYRARPGSRRFVHHLGDWYAQAHPTEDFAETFAVWLKPRSTWRSNYADWPALHKLELVDTLIRDVAQRKPSVRARERVDPLDQNERTLASHYQRRERQQIYQRSGFADEQLRRVFSTQRHGRALSAVALLRNARAKLVRHVVRECGVDRYTAYQMLRILLERARGARLYVRGSQRDALRHSCWLLARLTRAYSQTVRPPLPL